MKKLGLMALAVIGLAGCGQKDFDKDALNDTIALQAASGLGMIDSSVKTLSEVTTDTTTETTEQPQTLLDQLRGNEDVQKYIDMFDGLMKDGGPKYEISTSTKEGYEKSMVITKTNLLGEVTTYALYYNETDATEKDEDEDEFLYKLEGVAVINEIEYKLVGELELEEDEEEFKLEISLSDTDKLLIEQEKEADEMEYKYTYFKDGNKVSEEQIEIERENDKLSVKVKNKGLSGKEYFKFEQSNDEIKIGYGIDGVSEFKCKFTKDGQFKLETETK